ncbi:MAG: hypothetical protein ACRBF0_19740 [Calditrichia bacterium]
MTQPEYIAGLEWLIKVMPNHALRLALEKGYSDINCIYLRHSLNKLPRPKENTPPPGEDKVLIILSREKSDLFAHRAKWSNKFHQCQSDAERASVSDEIQFIQRKIKDVFSRIGEYKATGILPEEKHALTDQLPDNGIQLIQILNSKRSSISYTRRKIDQLAKLAERHPDKLKISDYETKLKELERERDAIQAKINQIAV